MLWRCWEVATMRNWLPILRAVKVVAIAAALATTPVACTVLTGFAPVDCEVAFCD